MGKALADIQKQEKAKDESKDHSDEDSDEESDEESDDDSDEDSDDQKQKKTPKSKPHEEEEKEEEGSSDSDSEDGMDVFKDDETTKLRKKQEGRKRFSTTHFEKFTLPFLRTASSGSEEKFPGNPWNSSFWVLVVKSTGTAPASARLMKASPIK